MTTLLVIDIGNTNVSIGLFDYRGAAEESGKLAQHWRTATHREQTSDEVALMIRSLFEHEAHQIYDRIENGRDCSHSLRHSRCNARLVLRGRGARWHHTSSPAAFEARPPRTSAGLSPAPRATNVGGWRRPIERVKIGR